MTFTQGDNEALTAFRSRNTKDQVKKHTRSSCSSVSTSTVPTKLVLGFEPLPFEKKKFLKSAFQHEHIVPAASIHQSKEEYK